jgi:hypothetical protein
MTDLRTLAGRGTIMKVIAREVIAFGVAFVVSLAISVAVAELIRGLISSEQQIATGQRSGNGVPILPRCPRTNLRRHGSCFPFAFQSASDESPAG